LLLIANMPVHADDAPATLMRLSGAFDGAAMRCLYSVLRVSASRHV